MEPHFDADADEPLLMARYLSCAGGLWPHVPPALPPSQSLFRTTSSPVGSFELRAHGPGAGRLSHSMSVASSLCTRGVGFPLPGDAGRGSTVDTLEEHSGAALEAEAEGMPRRDAEGMAPSTMPDVAALEKRRARSHLVECSGRLTQTMSQPLVRVVDFNVSHQIDDPTVEELPATPLRCGPRSGLSMLLNAPA